MRILAVDTATEHCSAALWLGDRLLVRERAQPGEHAEHILTLVDELLAEGGVPLTGLGAIAFGRGPGAFTGVRLAASVAQGLAFGADLPVVPVSNLRALAQRALDADVLVDRVLACSDARMREVYWATFIRDPAGLASPVGTEHVSEPSGVTIPHEWGGAGQFSAKLEAPVTGGQLCAAGTGFAAYPALRSTVAAGARTVLESLAGRATEVVKLALGEAAAGRLLPAEAALPVYLRDPLTRAPQAGSGL